MLTSKNNHRVVRHKDHLMAYLMVGHLITAAAICVRLTVGRADSIAGYGSAPPLERWPLDGLHVGVPPPRDRDGPAEFRQVGGPEGINGYPRRGRGLSKPMRAVHAMISTAI